MYSVGFVDTETTGFQAGNVPWQVGIICCNFTSKPHQRKSEYIGHSKQEFVLPILTADLGAQAYNKGNIIDASRQDSDEAAELARSEMRGMYCKHAFKEHMRDHLEDVRMARVGDIAQMLSSVDELWAWNARFDSKVISKLCGEDFDMQCAMQLFRDRFPGRRYKLELAADHFGISVNGVYQHTALYDTEILRKIWFSMNGISEKFTRKKRDDPQKSMRRRVAQAFGRAIV